VRYAIAGGACAALALVGQPCEPESTAYNLSHIRESCAATGQVVTWVDRIQHAVEGGRT